MPTINITGETYERLARRAAALRTSVDDVIDQMCREVKNRESELANHIESQSDSNEIWERHFQSMLQLARSHDGKYSPGYEADISRDAMNCDE